MAQIETWLRTDLKHAVRVQPIDGNLFSADNGANRVGVILTNNGQSVNITGGIAGYFIRSDEATVIITGSASGNRGWVDLPASAYVKTGPFSLVIKNGNTAIGACTGYVYRSSTDEIIDPGHVIPSIEELLAEITHMRQATADANTAATNANTKASAANTAAENANTKATAANNAATAANNAAGKISNMTVAASGLAAGASPTATISEVDGHKHILFGIPKGDTGDPGKDFHIKRTFASIAAMNAYDPEQDHSAYKVETNDFVMIDTGNVEDADTGKLFCYEPETQDVWRYIGDLSGKQGIQGPAGNGISSIVLNQDYTLTINCTDGTSYTTSSIRGEKGEKGETGDTGDQGPKGDTGSTGATGATPDISIGTVTTLLPNQPATVELDASSTPEAPVFNFGIPKGETGSAQNMYGSTIEMSPQDSTKVAAAIDGKLDKNQGSGNAGKYMKVGSTGELEPDSLDVSGKADKVANAVNGNFAGLDANGNLTDSGHKHSDYLTEHQDISGKLNVSEKGAANGVAELDANGLVPSSQLPSYVDDVLEYASISLFPATGESGKIYVDTSTNITYRWSGSTYVAIGSDLALGETSSTAYRGDRGAAAYAAAVTNVESTPTTGSNNLITSGGVKAALPGLMTGATSSDNGSAGLVPAPSAGDHIKVLMGDGNWEIAPGARIVKCSTTVTNTSGAYSNTVQDENITEDMIAIRIEIGTPGIFHGNITVTQGDGEYTVSCPDVAGTSTLNVYFAKQQQNPTAITSTEFDILNNRLLAVENVYTDTDVTIAAADWTAGNDGYTYTWQSELVTNGCGVEVFLRDGADSAGISGFDYSKVTGGVQFITGEQPSGSLPVTIRLINTKSDGLLTLNADEVLSEAIAGCDSVEEALINLDDRVDSVADSKVDKTDIIDNLTTNDSTKALSAAQGYVLNSNITGEYESLDTHVFIYRQGKQRTIIFKYAPNSEISGISLATKDRPAFWQWCFGLSTDGNNHYPVMAFVQLSADGGLIFQVFTGGYNADSGNTAPGASRLFHGALTYYVE